MDSAGIVRMWNRGAVALFGWSAQEALGKRVPFIAPEMEPEYDFFHTMVMSGKGFVGVETARRRKDGTDIDISISMVPLRSKNGSVVAVLGLSYDMTPVRAADAAAVHQANHDVLTGLPNRAAFLTALGDETSQPRSKAALLYLDIDNFQDVNDTQGHLLGDQLLGLISGRLRQSVRPKDMLARLGGDEFGVLLADVGPRSVSGASKQLIGAVSGKYALGGIQLTLGASAGVAFCNSADNAEQALRQAEMAMYEAKRTSRGTFKIFDDAMEKALVERVGLAGALRQALDNGQLEVYYQPIISLHSGSVVSVEALARWHHPSYGWVPPDRFIPLAENAGTIGQLGRWVLNQACSQLRSWQLAYPGSLTDALVMSVNLSGFQLSDKRLVSCVRSALTSNELIPANLCLEVTETALTDDISASEAVLRRLRRLGVTLAIDDFGTGNSSLTLLRRMPFGVLKVDKSFVDGIAHSAEDAAIVKATLEMAHSLGLVSLAEGVETADQLSFLRAHGCQEVQGYLLGRPVSPDELGPVLSGESSGMPEP